MLGVGREEEKIILSVIAKTAPDCNVIAYGSRVKGTHKDTSDLDLAFALPCGERLPYIRFGDIKEAFQESNLIFRVDVIDYNDAPQNFRDRIDADGEWIYRAGR